MKKFITILLLCFSSIYLFSQENKESQKNISEKQLQIEESLQNLQIGLENFQSQIFEKQQEIENWTDSINFFSSKLITGNNSIYQTKIDSLHKLINTNNNKINALNAGIEDISKTIIDLNTQLTNIDDYEDITFDNITADDYSSDDFNFNYLDPSLFKRKFRGHWAGLQLGVNTFLNTNNTLLPQTNYLSVVPENSREFSLNPIQKSFRIHKRYFGIVTGLGFTWNNYELFNNVQLLVDSTGSLTYIDSDINYIKNRFKLTSFNIPLIFEGQIPIAKRDRRIYISAGIVGNLNLNSKIKYKDYNNKVENKNNINWPIDSFSYKLTSRIGYNHFYFYANYSPMLTFIKGKAPEVLTFSAGIGYTILK